MTSDYGEDIVQSAVNNGQQVREAQPTFIVIEAEDDDDVLEYEVLGGIQPIPSDLQRYLLRPLAVPSPDPKVRDSQRKQFLERYEELRSHPSAQILKDQELEDALVSQGI